MYTLQPLSFEYTALEPVIDEQTMRLHHDKHHQTYVDKLNALLESFPDLQQKPVEDLLKDLKSVPKKIRESVKNFGGGHFNHSFFWQILKRDSMLSGEIVDVINKKFKSFDKFKELFRKEACDFFGSGWTWLVLNNKGKLKIVSTANQDCPLSKGQFPLLVIDLWEHAYYLKYQNRRAEFVDGFFNLINWEKVNENYKNASKPQIP